MRLVLCALLADGHVLIEDLPGVGKTTLVKTLARLLGLDVTRIQFTNDLLPADILGVSVYDNESRSFHFHPGPIFGQIVIADELNRATPKTQSALLQAMEERRVTVDGVTHELPQPFFVVATQNPMDQAGTYPLPDSQLDRFLMRISLGYPHRGAERDLLRGEKRARLIENLKAGVSADELLSWQGEVDTVHVSDAIVEYIQDLIDYTRAHPERMQGLSPRAGLGLLRAARTWALLEGRNMVIPEDVQAVAVAIMSHRLLRPGQRSTLTGEQIAKEVISAVAVD